MSDDKPGWQQQQDDRERNDRIREEGERQRRMGENNKNPFDSRTNDAKTHDDGYNGR